MQNMENSYFRVSFRDFLKQKAKGRQVFSVTFAELGITEHRTAAEMLLILPGFLARAKLAHIDLLGFLCYHDKKYLFVVKEWDTMRKAFCIDIPYGSREKYKRMIADINHAVSENGTVILAVSNIPYFLKCKLIIECVDGEENVIKKLIEKEHLSCDYSKGLEEISRDIANRIWNIITLSKMPEKELDTCINAMFTFPSIENLEAKGYHWDNEAKRKQIFISYSHRNQDIVRSIVDELLECEMNVFVDYRSIDYGEKIIEKISQGLKESDLCIFFLSKEFQNSYYGKHELSSIWNYVITKKKKWFLVLLDHVNVDDIYDGLSFYKYFKFDNNIQSLIEEIKKQMLS